MGQTASYEHSCQVVLRMSIKSRIYKNISWLFVGKIIRILGGLFISVWVARYLGPRDYGVLNYSLAYAALFTVFVQFGFDEIIVREVTKKPRLTDYFLGTAFGLKLAGSIIAITGVCISLYFVEMNTITRLIILIISFGFIFQSVDVIDFFYQSQILSRYVVMARTGAFLLGLALKIYLIIFKYHIVYFALAATFDFASASLFLILVYKKTHHGIRKWRFSKRIAKRLILFSWPVAISIFLVSIHSRIDQVMIGNMVNHEQVGVYSVAVRLAQFWVFIPAIIIETSMPHFIYLRESDNALYNRRLIQLYSFLFWMGMLIGIVTLIWGKSVIRILFGEVYTGAYGALVFNIWTVTFMSLGMARSIWVISENLQKFRLYNNIIAVIINISLNLLLIPVLGISGAAIATLVQQVVGVFALSFLWAPYRPSARAMIRSLNPYYLMSIKQDLWPN